MNAERFLVVMSVLMLSVIFFLTVALHFPPGFFGMF